MMKFSFSFIFILLFSLGAFAAHPLITDDTGVQGKGKFEVEVNGEWGREKNPDVVNSGEVAVAISCGLADRLDLGIGVPFVMENAQGSDTVHGVSDVGLELKWNFYEVEMFSFALKPGMSLPSGDESRGFGTGKIGYSTFFITTMTWESLAMHFNAGYARNENKADELENIWHFSLAAEYSIMDSFRLVVNSGAERNADRGDDTPPAFVLAGIIWSPAEWIDLDLGYKVGMTDPETDHSIMMGVTARW
jgi:hypothetical protein